MVQHPSGLATLGNLTRIAQVAAGVKSLIPGDQLVLQQVAEAHARTSAQSEIHHVTRAGIKLAREARERFDLVPDVDYADVPRTLRSDSFAGPDLLVVVGGGMLARAVAAAPGPGYQRVLIATRNPKRLRQSIRSESHDGTPVSAANIGDVLTACSNRRFNLVVATTSPNELYRTKIVELIAHRNANATLDLCAEPISRDTVANCRRISEVDFKTWLYEANQTLHARIREASEWIISESESRAEQLQAVAQRNATDVPNG
jgi:glutamyl-tRNA reductase